VWIGGSVCVCVCGGGGGTEPARPNRQGSATNQHNTLTDDSIVAPSQAARACESATAVVMVRSQGIKSDFCNARLDRGAVR
jgi:hypothetical protein